VLKSEGHFAMSFPSENLTGAQLRLTKRTNDPVPDLVINSVQPAGADQVDCRFNGIEVTKALFPAG
jgi:hypothetical protein